MPDISRYGGGILWQFDSAKTGSLRVSMCTKRDWRSFPTRLCKWIDLRVIMVWGQMGGNGTSLWLLQISEKKKKTFAARTVTWKIDAHFVTVDQTQQKGGFPLRPVWQHVSYSLKTSRSLFLWMMRHFVVTGRIGHTSLVSAFSSPLPSPTKLNMISALAVVLWMI